MSLGNLWRAKQPWTGMGGMGCRDGKNSIIWMDGCCAVCKDLGVSKNRGTPKSSILIGFSMK